MPTCLEVSEQKGRTFTSDLSQKATATETVPYLVRFDATGATCVQASNATSAHGSMPAYGDFSGPLWCTSKPMNQDTDDPRLFRGAAVYTIPVPGQEAAPASPDGDKWAIEITINTVRFEVEIDQDATLHAIVNTANDPIRGVTAPQYEEEISIAFTTDSIDWTGLDGAYGTLGRGTVNSVAVTMTINGQSRTFAIGSLLFCDYSMAITIDPTGLSYPRMTYKLRWRAAGWETKVANKGYYRIDAGHKTPIKDDNFHDIKNPVYLDTFTSGSFTDVIPLDAGSLVQTVEYQLFESYDLGGLLLVDLNS